VGEYSYFEHCLEEMESPGEEEEHSEGKLAIRPNNQITKKQLKKKD
jgi:hypothetical protein